MAKKKTKNKKTVSHTYFINCVRACIGLDPMSYCIAQAAKKEQDEQSTIQESTLRESSPDCSPASGPRRVEADLDAWLSEAV